MAVAFRFSKEEISDIIISTLALGFIFSWNFQLVTGNFAQFIVTALLTTLIVGLSFIPHELMHKYFANRFHCHARYEMWKTGLLIALGLAVISNGSFVFAAPGAVVIYTTFRSHMGIEQTSLSSRHNAIISAAGPLTNIAIAAAALVALQFVQHPLLLTIVRINAFLALFNLLPVPPLDGSKVIWYNIFWWLALIAVPAAMFMIV